MKKKIYSPGNNLSKSFVNLSGNNLEELEDNINEQKNIEIQNMKKNLDNNKFMTINIIKTSKSQIEKIKNNIYYESQNIKTKTNKEIKDNNYQIPINSTSNKKININNNIYNNNVITEIKGTTKDNNNNIIITLNSNTYNNIDTEKDKIPNIINTNQNININKNVINNNNNNNTNTNISKNTKDQIIRKNSKTNETYKKLKAEFDLLMNERYSVLLNKNISTLNTSNTIYNSSNTSSTLTISNSNLNILSKQRKKQEEAFQNYFKNPKYKIDQDKTKIKFLQNNDFFIGILDQEEKFPQKGIYLASNGEYYDGEFVNGKKEGEGKLIYVNGNQYQGSFLGGLPDGKGKLTQTNNDIYEGDWKNGKIMGQGERVYNNGDKYVGSLLNDIRNGKGLYLFINGDSYNGNWVNGKANGKGILRFRNGDIYDGEETNSFCGTAEYLAPEIITGEGHNMMADWWSYGTLIYEMLFGIPPFFSQNVEKMYEFITKSELKFPKKFKVTDDVKDFLTKLLIKNPKERFGVHGGFEEIKKHPFFKDIDFKAMEEKKIKAPFKPELKDSFDVRNFDEEFTSEDLSNSQINEKEMDLIQKNQEKFDEFDDDEDD